ncbi:phenylalanine--tRNA ligase subunit alpha [candidate division WOR-3 bacterium]|nr:phenylalanine--tRNA ligase subunit alpha [candidate division WOR-3 bacterium]
MEKNSLHPLEIKFLKNLKKGNNFSVSCYPQNSGLTPENVRGIIGWFKAKNWLEEVEEKVSIRAEITDEGKTYAQNGHPMRLVLDKLAISPLTIKEMIETTGYGQAEIGKAVGFLKKNELALENDGFISPTGKTIPEYLEILEKLMNTSLKKELDLESLSDMELKVLEENAKKRGSGSIFRLKEMKTVVYRLNEEGEKARASIEGAEDAEEIGALTPEMLRERSWDGKLFRKYGFSIKPRTKLAGRFHPYGRFLDTVRKELTSMGFTEMRGPIVESEFFNNDVLFMPQYHSARDIHDIYIVKEPSKANDIPVNILKKIASAHRDGGRSGSRGWGYDFDTEKTQRLVLRSQGTAISAREMTKKPPVPGKFFAIARCFRYDSVDATHAPDFFQIEGIVLEENINFRHLLGLLSNFAQNLAHAEEIKFVPGYFPFTEPSVEAMIKHPQLGWIELGGAGIFRPEITVSLEIPCPVIAWGLGLDRMAMNALKINDIRELFTQDFEKIRSAKVVL